VHGATQLGSALLASIRLSWKGLPGTRERQSSLFVLSSNDIENFL
jgi:hypothetical protein